MIESVQQVFLWIECLTDHNDLNWRFLLDRLEVYSTMFAQRADDIFRKFITFVDISADLADKAFLSFCLWFWFDIVLVIGVGHGLLVTHDASFGDTADEHAVGSEVNILFYFERHECVDVFVKEYKSVTGTVDFLTFKFIYSSAGLETEPVQKQRTVLPRTDSLHSGHLSAGLRGESNWLC